EVPHGDVVLEVDDVGGVVVGGGVGVVLALQRRVPRRLVVGRGIRRHRAKTRFRSPVSGSSPRSRVMSRKPLEVSDLITASPLWPRSPSRSSLISMSNGPLK